MVRLLLAVGAAILAGEVWLAVTAPPEYLAWPISLLILTGATEYMLFNGRRRLP